jgi:hypothetical protein
VAALNLDALVGALAGLVPLPAHCLVSLWHRLQAGIRDQQTRWL